jgi:FliA/WhiG family RNA polymerase sigma factor
MRASTQYSNTQKRSPKPTVDGDVPVGEIPQQELVIKHADLVKRIAYHLVSRMPPNVEVDDLIQSGMMGLLEAAKHYCATKGANFETYAGIRIRGAMLDEVRKSDWTPRSVHRNTREMADVIRKIENEKGKDATPTDIATGLGVSIEEYHKLVQDAASCRLFSFDQLGSSDDESSPADHARDEAGPVRSHPGCRVSRCNGCGHQRLAGTGKTGVIALLRRRHEHARNRRGSRRV